MSSIWFEPATGIVREELVDSRHANYRVDERERARLETMGATADPECIRTLTELERENSRDNFGKKRPAAKEERAA